MGVAVVDAGLSDHKSIAGAAKRDLARLADDFLAGVVPDAASLYAGTGRRRVPLPVYPLQPTRYWVKDSAAAVAPAVTAPVDAPVPSTQAQVRQPKVRLLDPVAAASWPSPAAVAVKVRLAPITEAEADVARAAPMSREIGADGVCKLAPSGPWNTALEINLADEIQAVSALPDVRTIMITAPAEWSIFAAGSAARVIEAMLGLPSPDCDGR